MSSRSRRVDARIYVGCIPHIVAEGMAFLTLAHASGDLGKYVIDLFLSIMLSPSLQQEGEGKEGHYLDLPFWSFNVEKSLTCVITLRSG